MLSADLWLLEHRQRDRELDARADEVRRARDLPRAARAPRHRAAPARRGVFARRRAAVPTVPNVRARPAAAGQAAPC